MLPLFPKPGAFYFHFFRQTPVFLGENVRCKLKSFLGRSPPNSQKIVRCKVGGGIRFQNICPQVRKMRRKQIPVRITGGRTPAAVLGSIRMFFFWTVNWLSCKAHTLLVMRTTSTGCQPIWPPAESTTPTITPQFARGWTRTANRSPEKITTIQRPMRKENACECKSNHGCNR